MQTHPLACAFHHKRTRELHYKTETFERQGAAEPDQHF